MRCSRFDSFSVLLDLPLFADLPVCSPVCWLDAVEDDSSVIDEFEFGIEFGIRFLVETPVDVERLSVVIFELIRVCSFFPVTFKNSTSILVLYGCAPPDSSFWRHETWSHIHTHVWS